MTRNLEISYSQKQFNSDDKLMRKSDNASSPLACTDIFMEKFSVKWYDRLEIVAISCKHLISERYNGSQSKYVHVHVVVSLLLCP